MEEKSKKINWFNLALEIIRAALAFLAGSAGGQILQ